MFVRRSGGGDAVKFLLRKQEYCTYKINSAFDPAVLEVLADEFVIRPSASNKAQGSLSNVGK
jgi:hypothetical protein